MSIYLHQKVLYFEIISIFLHQNTNILTEVKSILDLLIAFPNEQSCINHLEMIRWNVEVVSPFDENSKVYKCANNKYKCKSTGKFFNVRTNTVYDYTKITLQKWFLVLYVFSSHKKGINSHQLAKDISVTQKSTWFLLHRLSYAFEHPNFKAILEGHVEIDETFVFGYNKNRHPDKKVENSQGRSYKDKTPVLGMLQREGLRQSLTPEVERITLIKVINSLETLTSISDTRTKFL